MGVPPRSYVRKYIREILSEYFDCSIWVRFKPTPFHPRLNGSLNTCRVWVIKEARFCTHHGAYPCSKNACCGTPVITSTLSSIGPHCWIRLF